MLQTGADICCDEAGHEKAQQFELQGASALAGRQEARAEAARALQPGLHRGQQGRVVRSAEGQSVLRLRGQVRAAFIFDVDVAI